MTTINSKHRPKGISKRPVWEQLRAWRKSQKKSQERIAQYLGISPHTFWKWENAIAYPSDLAIYRLNQMGFFIQEYASDKDKDA